MGKRLYTAYSPYSFIMMILLRAVIIAGLIYMLPHFNENPVLISILAIIAAAAIIFLGDDQVSVYTDTLEQATNSLADYFFKLKATVYEIKDIKKIYVEPQPPAGRAFEIGVAVLLNTAIGNKARNKEKSTKIVIELKDGKIAEMLTDLEDKKVAKILEIVNSLITIQPKKVH